MIELIMYILVIIMGLALATGLSYGTYMMIRDDKRSEREHELKNIGQNWH